MKNQLPQHFGAKMKKKKVELKKLLFIAALFLISAANAQPFIQASIAKSATPNKADIWFRANYNSVPGEYVNFLQFSVAIPASLTNGNTVIAQAVGVGQFANMGVITQAPQYTQGAERIFTWIFVDPSFQTQSWLNNVPFVGVEVSFAQGQNLYAAQVKMLDFSNISGGGNNNTYFGITTSSGDRTRYPALFFQMAGLNILGFYASGDQFVQTIQYIALPSTLTEFGGYKSGMDNVLSWKTASEINMRGFDLERSLDGINYTSVGFINSSAVNGNSFDPLNYSFTDHTPPGIKQYYRLRMVDLNGASRYSQVIIIQRDKPQVLTIDGIFPNPAIKDINVRIASPEKQDISMVVSDMSGKAIIRSTASLVAGNNIITLDVDRLAAGTYILRTITKNGLISEKFLKQ